MAEYGDEEKETGWKGRGWAALAMDAMNEDELDAKGYSQCLNIEAPQPQCGLGSVFPFLPAPWMTGPRGSMSLVMLGQGAGQVCLIYT